MAVMATSPKRSSGSGRINPAPEKPYAAHSASSAAIPSVTSAGHAAPRPAARASRSPAPNRRYQSGPPAMHSRCVSDAAALAMPPAASQTRPAAIS